MNVAKPLNITIDIKSTLISLIDNVASGNECRSDEECRLKYSQTLKTIKTILENIKEV